MDTTAAGTRPDPDKSDWADYADTTLAHNRGTQGNAQLEAEGRTLPGGGAQTATAPPAPERAVAAPQRAASPAASSTDLAGLTVKELKERARDAGIDGFSTMNKADLVTALSA